MVTTILGFFGTIIGYAVSLVIFALVARFVFEVCVWCIEFAWETLHEPSLVKFKAKMTERKANKKVRK